MRETCRNTPTGERTISPHTAQAADGERKERCTTLILFARRARGTIQVLSNQGGIITFVSEIGNNRLVDDTDSELNQFPWWLLP